jgi:hypothetical protein
VKFPACSAKRNAEHFPAKNNKIEEEDVDERVGEKKRQTFTENMKSVFSVASTLLE